MADGADLHIDVTDPDPVHAAAQQVGPVQATEDGTGIEQWMQRGEFGPFLPGS